VMMYTDKLCYTNWFQPANCTAAAILSYRRNPVHTVMIQSRPIRDTSRGRGTAARYIAGPVASSTLQRAPEFRSRNRQ